MVFLSICSLLCYYKISFFVAFDIAVEAVVFIDLYVCVTFHAMLLLIVIQSIILLQFEYGALIHAMESHTSLDILEDLRLAIFFWK